MVKVKKRERINEVARFLHNKCGICFRCIELVFAPDEERQLDFVDIPAIEYDLYCSVCFGLSSPSFHVENILSAIQDSLAPYCSSNNVQCNEFVNKHPGIGGIDSDVPFINYSRGNYLSKESPTIQIPLLIAARAHCAVAAARWMSQKDYNDSAKDEISFCNAEDIYAAFKDKLKGSIRSLLDSSLEFSSHIDIEREDFLDELHDEEAGYLSIHIIVLPPTITSLGYLSSNTDQNVNNDVESIVSILVPPTLQSIIENQKVKIQQNQHKLMNPRSRFRGNDPTSKQGGDPRKNLEMRLRRLNQNPKSCDVGQPLKRRRLGTSCDDMDVKESCEFLNDRCHSEIKEICWNTMISWLSKDTLKMWIERNDPSSDFEWLQRVHQEIPDRDNSSKTHGLCSVFATTWRRPFCIHGFYTKTRRDVSQSPFYVALSSKELISTNAVNIDRNSGFEPHPMIRKGVSSVEEEICSRLAAVGCGGISTRNNDFAAHSGRGAVVFGMCKFHASGREDMDVRMVLPPSTVLKSSAKLDIRITGRPFVCEILDAHHLPTLRDLKNTEKSINCLEDTRGEDVIALQWEADVEWDERGWPQTCVEKDRSYGCNPLGVGVSSLKFVQSNVFASLQSETEERVKYYGCVCWSEKPIDSEEQLTQKLGCEPWAGEGVEKSTCKYPLKIYQATPLRVLHRRSSDVRTRHILNLRACSLDRHWFRLQLSTSAGTYVKEFVHGDCGRTYPSIQSMLDCRTDITELDCLGIAS